MKMKLEQITYEVPRALKRKQVVYQVGDLESLSATALYYGDGSSSGSSAGSGGGFGGFGIIESAYEKGVKKGPSSGGPKPSLTIRDFPGSGFQLHIHEGLGGTGHLKTYSGEKIPMSSYEAAMGDLYADALKKKEEELRWQWMQMMKDLEKSWKK